MHALLSFVSAAIGNDSVRVLLLRRKLAGLIKKTERADREDLRPMGMSRGDEGRRQVEEIEWMAEKEHYKFVGTEKS